MWFQVVGCARLQREEWKRVELSSTFTYDLRTGKFFLGYTKEAVKIASSRSTQRQIPIPLTSHGMAGHLASGTANPETLHFSGCPTSRRLVASLFTRLAGGDSGAAVWRLPACGRVPRGSPADAPPARPSA